MMRRAREWSRRRTKCVEPGFHWLMAYAHGSAALAPVDPLEHVLGVPREIAVLSA